MINIVMSVLLLLLSKKKIILTFPEQFVLAVIGIFTSFSVFWILQLFVYYVRNVVWCYGKIIIV